MSTISIDSHDFLGKLSIIKNYLSIVLSSNTIAEEQKVHVQTAFDANEKLIKEIKERITDTPVEQD